MTPVGQNPPPVDWRTLGTALAPAACATAWLVYQASWFWRHQPDLQFGWIVLLLSMFLLSEVQDDLPPLRPRWTVGVAVLYGLGFLSMLLFQMYQAAFGTMAASLMALAFGAMAVVTANIVQMFGWRVVPRVAFPFYFLLIALPLPSFAQSLVVSRLQMLVATLNEDLLNLVGIPAIRRGSVIELTTGMVGVDDACSGFRSLQSSIMAGLFIGFILFRNWSWCLLMGLSAVLLAVVGNLGRTFYLCREGALKGVSAVQGVHDAAGWSVMAFTAVGVAGIAWGLNRVRTARGGM